MTDPLAGTPVVPLALAPSPTAGRGLPTRARLTEELHEGEVETCRVSRGST